MAHSARMDLDQDLALLRLLDGYVLELPRGIGLGDDDCFAGLGDFWHFGGINLEVVYELWLGLLQAQLNYYRSLDEAPSRLWGVHGRVPVRECVLRE